MRGLFALVLYAAVTAGANAAPLDEGVKQGDMRKLVLADAEVPDIAFVDETGAEHRLADWKGKPILVNFWATWCAPCREEMPSLQALQREFADTPFEVVTIATGRSSDPAVQRFFSETGVTDLPRLRDPNMALARGMGVLGLPVSVLIDAEGREVARLIGDADWSAPEAKAVVETLLR